MHSHFQNVFRYCPICGTATESTGQHPFVCESCDFHFYFPPTIAVGAIIANSQGQILFIERAKNPGRGMLGLPGGFVDAEETAETAASREIKEEVGLDAKKFEYLTTFPNVYEYKGVTNDILDIFYVCRIEETSGTITPQTGEVAAASFETPTPSILNRMAFESNRKAVEFFQTKFA